MSDCLFCRILRREIPATVVYEDDQLLAFKDIFPQAPVHILIVPKIHCDGLNDLTPEVIEVVPKILQTAAKLAQEQGISESGWRLLANCGEHAGQTVFHLHFHLLGGKPLGGKLCL
jgi:histidine triad (HIT) family protein